MNAFPTEGIIAALAVPTDARGRLRRSALARHLRWLRQRGVHGVLAVGSTGEFPRFTLEERKRILAAIAAAAGSLPVLANISDIRPAAAIELGRFARGLGLPGVALMPPSFFPVSAADQLAYFLHVAEAVGLPVLLYNYPELIGNRIAPETVDAFARRAPMIGIKQSGAEFAYHKQLVALGRKRKFAVFSGADTRLPEVFALGAAGCIGGLVNFAPEPMLEIFRARGKKAPSDGRRAAGQMREIGRLIDRLTFPLNVAAGMEARGLDPGDPKMIVSPESARIYRTLVIGLRRRFQSWHLPPARG